MKKNIPAICYVAINQTNNKKYIGMTRRPLKSRINSHRSESKKKNNYPFYNAIRKYGIVNFNFYTLSKHETIKEAQQEEIRLIALVNPEYNMTDGGGGTSGLIFSEASKKKMSMSADKERFKKYAHLGPKKSSKKVICIDDGKIFDSASEAARFYNSSKSAVIELCLGKNFRKTVNKRKFKYLENA